MDLKGLTIGITGGAGFVGSHTGKFLQANGARVLMIDRERYPETKDNCERFYWTDYDDKAALGYFRQHKVDGIIHCAGTSLVGPSILNPLGYYHNNVSKTISMLENISRWENKPFIIFSSSAAVYGNHRPGVESRELLSESHPKDPCNPYGQTKLMIEQILRDCRTAFDISSISLRYFNACGADVWDSKLGPGPDDTHIIPRMFQAHQKGEAFKLFGDDYQTPDGTCIRDYIHVCDIAEAHATACLELKKQATEGSLARAFNLGSNKGYSNLELITAFNEYVHTLCGDAKLEYTIEPRREGDPDILQADGSQFQRTFNWAPQYSDLPTIISSTGAFYEGMNYGDINAR